MRVSMCARLRGAGENAHRKRRSLAGTYAEEHGATSLSTCSGRICAAGKYGPTGATSAKEATCWLCPTGKRVSTHLSSSIAPHAADCGNRLCVLACQGLAHFWQGALTARTRRQELPFAAAQESMLRQGTLSAPDALQASPSQATHHHVRLPAAHPCRAPAALTRFPHDAT